MLFSRWRKGWGKEDNIIDPSKVKQKYLSFRKIKKARAWCDSLTAKDLALIIPGAHGRSGRRREGRRVLWTHSPQDPSLPATSSHWRSGRSVRQQLFLSCHSSLYICIFAFPLLLETKRGIGVISVIPRMWYYPSLACWIMLASAETVLLFHSPWTIEVGQLLRVLHCPWSKVSCVGGDSSSCAAEWTLAWLQALC